MQDFLESKVFQPRKDSHKVSNYYYKPLTSRNNLNKTASNLKSNNQSIGNQTLRQANKKPDIFEVTRYSHPVNKLAKFLSIKEKSEQKKKPSQPEASQEPMSSFDVGLQKVKQAADPKEAVDQIMKILRQEFNLTKSDLINLLNSEDLREDALVFSCDVENRQRLHFKQLRRVLPVCRPVLQPKDRKQMERRSPGTEVRQQHDKEAHDDPIERVRPEVYDRRE
jgi:hypothetical protein